MKRVQLTSEWLASWSPSSQQEVADRQCRGLLVRCGPSGVKAFYRWTTVADRVTGAQKRRRVKLARWSIDGGGGGLSLGEAREAYLCFKEDERKSLDGSEALSVAQVAEAYRRDILSHREQAAAAWNILRVHIVEAVPDPKRPPFGEWPAKLVKPADVASVVRHAIERRILRGRPVPPSDSGASSVRSASEEEGKGRRLGGPVVARVVLRELKAMFGHAVETGGLEMTPAGVLRGRSFGLRATSRNRVLDREEMSALFDALELNALLAGTAKEVRLSATVRLGIGFLAYVPIRTHSFIGARWEEFDLEKARWTVPVARLKLTKDRRQSARPFVVPLPATALAILKKIKEQAPKSPWVLTSPAEPQKLGRRRKAIEYRHVDGKAMIRALARLQEQGRLALGSRVTIHDLRRTWRSIAEEIGVDPTVAEKSLGHVTPLRTLGFSSAADVYARSDVLDRRKEAADRVAEVLDGIRRP